MYDKRDYPCRLKADWGFFSHLVWQDVFIKAHQGLRKVRDTAIAG